MKRAPTHVGSGWILSPDDSGPRVVPRPPEPEAEPPSPPDKRHTGSLARRIDGGAATVELTEGSIVANRYRLTRFIGRGAMGVVWEGQHVTVGRTVAVKVLPQEWAGDKTMGRRFRAEARAASAAGHPNIVEVFDAGELEDGRPFLVMEFLDGQDTRDLLSLDGTFDVARACRIIRDAARALHAAHARGVIHRDLKPENIFVVEASETVKVLDFGIAIQSEIAAARMTSPGVAVGTPETMAPEQVFGAAPAPSFDIYALGVVLFELLAGHPPIWDADATQTLRRKAAEDAPSLAPLCPAAPDALVDLVARALARDPEARPHTADALADELDEILAAMSREPAVVPLPRRRSMAPVGLVAAALVLAAAVLVVFLPPTDAERPNAFTDALSPTVDAVARSAVVPERVREPVPVPEPEPEPVPVPVPEPAVEEAPPLDRAWGGPRSRRHHAAPPTAPPKPRATAKTAPVDDRCERTRARAFDARQVHDWSGVLRHTSRAKCWDVAIDRKRLRVQALMETGQFGACVDAARGSADAKVGRWRRICERRRDEG